jgi:hypothetical protein
MQITKILNILSNLQNCQMEGRSNWDLRHQLVAVDCDAWRMTGFPWQVLKPRKSATKNNQLVINNNVIISSINYLICRILS